jgi:hypothetical protein
MLVVDAANVIGSRPTGWWRDRPGAARLFTDQIRRVIDAGGITEPVVVVLEGKARQGVPSGSTGGLTINHAAASGDDALVEVVAAAAGDAVTLVTADRELRRRAEALGAAVVGPTWLLHLLET